MAAPGARLVVTRPDRQRPLELSLSSPFGVGREPTNALVLSDAASSKHHARFELRGDTWWIEDLGSRNGTLLDGRLLRREAAALRGGETVGIGQTRIGFALDGARRDQDDPEQFPTGTRLLAAREPERTLVVPSATEVGAAGLARAYDKVRAALELSRRIGATRDVAGLLDEVAGACVELLDADAGGVYRVGPDGAVETLAKRRDLEVSGTLVRRVAGQRQAVLLADAAQDAGLAGARSVVAASIRSMIAVPVSRFDEVYAVLALDSRERRAAFDEGDLEVLVALAAQVGLALERQRIAEQRAQEDAVRAQLSRFLSPDLVEQVRSGALRLDRGGELQQVAVLYSDIRGYTTWSERVGPEATVRGLNEYFERMVSLVFQHGGTLDKFIGDALMATWGATTPAPDGARRALSCARDMMQELSRLNAERAARGDDALEIGIGVHRGPAMAGLIGAPQRVEFTVIGDSVNVAARLMGKAERGQILASISAHRAAGDGFAARTVGTLQVKGRLEPVEVVEIRS